MSATRESLLAVLVAVGIGACGGTPPPAKHEPLPEIGAVPTSCKVTEDCELIPACCGCNAGGKQMAIRKDAIASFEASRAARCSGQMCSQTVSTDSSCDAEAICGSSGRCVVAPHLQHDQPPPPVTRVTPPAAE